MGFYISFIYFLQELVVSVVKLFSVSIVGYVNLSEKVEQGIWHCNSSHEFIIQLYDETARVLTWVRLVTFFYQSDSWRSLQGLQNEALFLWERRPSCLWNVSSYWSLSLDIQLSFICLVSACLIPLEATSFCRAWVEQIKLKSGMKPFSIFLKSASFISLGILFHTHTAFVCTFTAHS